jgi:hypothetical protein
MRVSFWSRARRFAWRRCLDLKRSSDATVRGGSTLDACRAEAYSRSKTPGRLRQRNGRLGSLANLRADRVFTGNETRRQTVDRDTIFVNNRLGLSAKPCCGLVVVCQVLGFTKPHFSRLTGHQLSRNGYESPPTNWLCGSLFILSKHSKPFGFR